LGAVRLNWTVRSSIFSTLATHCFCAADGSSSGVFRNIFMVKTTSSALKASPSCQVTPSRSLSVQTSSVSFDVKLSASHGISSPVW
jgi:hypothetical protein